MVQPPDHCKALFVQNYAGYAAGTESPQAHQIVASGSDRRCLYRLLTIPGAAWRDPVTLKDATMPHRIAPFPAAELIPGIRAPRAPLQGLTILAVEDSRFAADALRLMARRSGARLRRAATIRDAQAHLRVYRPDLVLVDLGLPDGDGVDLIRDLAASTDLQGRVLGMSGESRGRALAFAAGASAFLEKPLPHPRRFQNVLLGVLGMPEETCRVHDTGRPDALALHDDLRQAALWLTHPAVRRDPRYLVDFVAGLARQSGDAVLFAAACAARQQCPAALDQLATLITQRITTAPTGIAAPMR
jgi:CheY-like chemotaxis protein